MKAIRGRFRAAVLMGAVLAFAAGATAQNQNSNSKSTVERQFGAKQQSAGLTQQRAARPYLR